MSVLDTAVDPRAQSYLDARTAMLASLAELETALDAAREGGGERAVTRHHARGKLLARERIELLVDRDSPLLELSPVAGWGTDTPVGAAVVTAIGVVEDLVCVIVASDPTVRGGAVCTAALRKIQRAQRIALENRLPMINLMEATGIEPAERSEVLIQTGEVAAGFARLAAAGIPTAGAFFGDTTVVGGADLAECFDHLVALRAPAAARPVDQLAEDERDALRLTRQCLVRSRARAPGGGPPPAVVPPKHDPEDLFAVPVAEPREILGRILDGSDFDEVQPGYGTGLCTGWGEVHGHRVAVLADAGPRPATGAGEEADKAVRFVRRAEVGGTPLLLLRHGPALAPQAESGVARAAVPLVTVRVGDRHGLSAAPARARFRFAWPGARAALTGLSEHGDVQDSALHLSGRLDDDGLIDPRDTRTVLGFCLTVMAGGRS